jgi:hypothetical protein
MDESRDRIGSSIQAVLLGVLAFFALGLALPGGAVYLSVVDDWAKDPRGFHGIEGAVGWVLGVGAAIAIAIGLIFGGVALRLLPWRRAPLASLALAIASTGFVIATYLIFSSSTNSLETLFLQVVSIAMLILVSLPPFLHWAMTKPVIVPATTESSR